MRIPRTSTLGAAAAAGAVLLLANTFFGPDFRHYLEWAAAFRSGDITAISSHVLSPMAVPLSPWSFGPGLIFAAVPAWGPLDLNALAVGWVLVLAFWAAMYRILAFASRGRRPLILLGLGATFAGTPVGFYSSAIASEALSYPCLAVAILLVIETASWGPVETLALGACCALLVTVRPELGLYAVVPLLVAGRSLIARPTRRGLHLALLTAPLAIAGAEILLRNWWMTGAFLHSPYWYGGGGFESLDFGHPEFAAVLVHPWHGLLTYHPLYALLLAVPVVMAFERRPASEKAVLAGLTVAVLLHVYVYASWYVWWLGLATFGMRGLGIAGVVLVPVLCRFLSEPRRRGIVRASVACVLAASAWSALLMLAGRTEFYTYGQLWLGQLHAARALVPHGIAAVWRLAEGGAAGVVRRLQSRLVPGVVALLLCLAAGLVLDRATRRWQRSPRGLSLCMLASGAAIVIFVACTGLFVRLAVRTDALIAARSIPLQGFRFEGSVPVDEAADSYREYLRVPGFVGKKQALARFVAAARISGTRALEAERARAAARSAARNLQ